MIKKVYYLKPHKFLDYDLATLLYGFRYSENPPLIIEVEDIENIPHLSEEIFFAGDIKQIKKILKLQSLSYYEMENFPNELIGLYGRKIESSTWEEVNKGELKKLFVKPKQKGIFSPYVGLFPFINDPNGESYLNISESTEIWVQDPIDLFVEYRCFVYFFRQMDVRKYYGFAWDIQPSLDFVNKCCSLLRPEPPYDNLNHSFALDIGILKDGSEVVIEVNNGYAFASYGLEPKLYASMHAETWKFWCKKWKEEGLTT